jgi:hypothetical protein
VSEAPIDEIIAVIDEMLRTATVPPPFQAPDPPEGEDDDRAPSSQDDTFLVKSVKKLVNANRVSSATNRLESFVSKESIIPIASDEIINQLRVLHPEANEADDLPELSAEYARNPYRPSRENVSAAVSSLPKESGAGMSPWSNELIQLFFKAGDAEADSVVDLVQALASGTLRHSRVWLSSRLIACRKSNGKIRPIAISDPWIRLCGRVLCKEALNEANSKLGPHQLGIGKSGGAEILTHSLTLVRDAMFANPTSDLGIAALDCSNAFNSIRRSFIERAVRSACPRLLPFFYWSYQHPTPLMASYNHHIIDSSTGVRQGDPLGPMLFSLGVHYAVDTVRSDYPTQILTYLDDIFLVGRAQDCTNAFLALSTSFAGMGLRFNAQKSSLFHRNPPPNSPFPVHRDGIEVLGLPIGTYHFVRSSLRDAGKKQTKVVDTFGKFDAPESFALLRFSINSRPIYNARGIRPADTEAYAAQFDRDILEGLRRIVRSNHPLSDDARDVKNLPSFLGGLGMRCLSRIRSLAYSSSWLTSLRFIKEHFRAVYAYSTHAEFDPAMLRSLPWKEKPPDPGPDVNSFVDLVQPMIDVASPPTQRALTATLDDPTFNNLLARLQQSNPSSAAWLRSSAHSGISSWLWSATCPIAGLRLSPAHFLDALRHRLLLSCYEDFSPVRRRCRCCAKETIEDWHGLSCKLPSEIRQNRHDRALDVLHSFIREVIGDRAQMTFDKDVLRGRTVPGRHACEPDLTVHLGAFTYYVDMVITNPSMPTALTQGSAATAKTAAKMAEKKKRGKYKTSHGSGISSCVVPFAVEATGLLGPAADAFLETIKAFRKEATQDEDAWTKAKDFFVRRLTTVVATGNGLLVEASRVRCEVVRTPPSRTPSGPLPVPPQ